MEFDKDLLLCIRQGNNEEAQAILEGMNPAEMVDSSGTTLLHVAADCENIDMTKYLIGKECKIDAVDNLGNTPLLLAVRKHHYRLISTLLEANARVLMCNNKGISAAKIVFSERWRIQINEDVILKKFKEECSNDSLRTAQKLIEIGCSLSRAARLADSTVTKYFLENGFKANEENFRGREFTALHNAVIKSDVESVKLLVSYGADLNAEDWVRRRPLDFVRENKKILGILLDHGALLTDNGILAGSHLFQCSDKELVEKLIADYNLDLFAKSSCKSTLCHFLMINRKFNPVGILKKYWKDSFNINETNYRNCTLLMYASIADNADSVKFLLEKGAKVNILSKDGYSALAYIVTINSKNKIALKARLKIVRLLLQYGSDIQWTNRRQHTLVDEVLRATNFEMAKIILARLALLEVLNIRIEDLILYKIHSHVMFERYYEFCRRTIEKFKRISIKKRVTLFDFLTFDGKSFIHFARSDVSVSRVKLMMYHKRRSNLYYHKVLQQRVAKAILVVNLRKHAFDMVSQILQLQNNQLVMEKIVDYLICDDLQIIASHPIFQDPKNISEGS